MSADDLKTRLEARDLTICHEAKLRIEALERELAEVGKDAERYRWLRDLACNSLSVSKNEDHACNYVTAKEWIERFEPEDFANTAPGEIDLMKFTNTIWRLQIYPHTPVGFNLWNGSTLDSVIAAAIKENQHG